VGELGELVDGWGKGERVKKEGRENKMADMGERGGGTNRSQLTE
jgi:hypothetical protein